MSNQGRARARRLLAWLALNSIIFIACYLNYRLQLKHRYLYKILSVGLCLSRAAAMVINFNLLLVWLPMCKYTLTKLAVFASRSLRHLRDKHNHLLARSSPPKYPPPLEHLHHPSHLTQLKFNQSEPSSATIFARLTGKLKQSAGDALRCVRCAICSLKIKFTSNFLIAVDHCTSLHTICATTITVASVIHTVAHIMNVINFSNRFDPLLGDLNMATHKGQNPIQLLVSVPGLTGCLMVVILFLMSLSSISIIRNSSYDLFQIFHRLSVLFVILLILHPSSHVLKEQNNVDRHHPDFCHDKMVELFDGQSALSAGSRNDSLLAKSNESVSAHDQRAQSAGTDKVLHSSEIRSRDGEFSNADWANESRLALFLSNQTEIERLRGQLNQTDGDRSEHNQTATNDLSEKRKRDIQDQTGGEYVGEIDSKLASETLDTEDGSLELTTNDNQFCLDIRPTFVAQNSICWYVLGAGLSCYLLDLLLRRLRRSRSAIQLLDACTDAEGNLIELVFSNNHKRFVHWLPGQFVYLNCPQIATYEWHPFTISSMDNDSRQFTLHIKAGGDWTRKLRFELEQRQQDQQQCQKWHPTSKARQGNEENSMSLFYQLQLQRGSVASYYCALSADNTNRKTSPGFISSISSRKNSQLLAASRPPMCGRDYSKILNVIADHEVYDQRTGQPQVECKRFVPLVYHGNNGHEQRPPRYTQCADDCVKIDLDQVRLAQKYRAIGHPEPSEGRNHHIVGNANQRIHNLDLFIDGPFHSPFERLLEQQVSVCIANGVGWTAFSSIFHQITNSMPCSQTPSDVWWSQWRNFRPTRSQAASHPHESLALDTKLHLVVILATIEQFKPFYSIARKYFDRISDRREPECDSHLRNPVQEVTAFITRSTKREPDVVEFCRKENLNLADPVYQGQDLSEILKINETFVVRFGRPNFEQYLSSFDNLYNNKRKISVYCCGSYQVKRAVAEICKSLNRSKRGSRPRYQYHEENF